MTLSEEEQEILARHRDAVSGIPTPPDEVDPALAAAWETERRWTEGTLTGAMTVVIDGFERVRVGFDPKLFAPPGSVGPSTNEQGLKVTDVPSPGRWEVKGGRFRRL